MAVPECLLPGFCPPPGPSTPFGSPLLVLLDTVRLAVLLIGLATLWRLTTVGPNQLARSRRIGYAGAGLLVLGAIGTELNHLGDHAHYRLLLFVVGVGLIAWGVYTSEKPGRGDDSAPGRHHQA